MGHISQAPDFYIDDHAVLYGVFAKQASAILGEKGLEICDQAVVLMGRERGLRSAKRCLANGEALSYRNYLIYGEWHDEKGWSKLEVESLSPVYQTKVLACGWNTSWDKYGFSDFGWRYCKEIDDNLLFGFNPQLHLEMGKFLTKGDGCCTFKWVECHFENEEELKALMSRRSELIPTVTKDFLFHCGHLLSCFLRALYFNVGLIAGNEVFESAMREYASLFTEEKANKIIEASKQDFINI